MAYKLQAVAALAPQVVSAGAVHDGDLLEDMTEDTGISEGEALQVKAS